MHLTVPEENDGQRLDLFLVSVVADQSRSQIQRLIKDGHVTVAGKVGKSNLAVKQGQDLLVIEAMKMENVLYSTRDRAFHVLPR